ncbi:FMN-linked oxidoreductase [Aspergillus ellipticus CBS 707.79]|uniref:FMN-linked oxidoreductase n=1 Tax=Aspergillus ellipticus CBS 707.79 TaxID=1448320 RepID=A0A319CWG4_9EURO|nr:FMN-linked oxidoreductase [Aspergillus ellipticus CBS 707.79]
MSQLFQPLKVGRMSLKHRIALAPMTRLRADTQHTPLPITQIAAWQQITSAVHARGSYIYLQLWALGRTANPTYLTQTGYDLISSSDVPFTSQFSGETHYPRAMSEKEIEDAIGEYAVAARNAMAAGFDGVEVHGANGYLIDQFLQEGTNRRRDWWGGNVENRSRFAVEVVRAVVDVVGGKRTAVRLSPWGRFQGMGMEGGMVGEQFRDLVRRLRGFGLGYLHLVESERKDEGEGLGELVDVYGGAGPVVVAGGYDGEKAERALQGEYKGRDVVVAFARPFIGNPDLVDRVRRGVPLVGFSEEGVYGQEEKGYSDYPFHEGFGGGEGARL